MLLLDPMLSWLTERAREFAEAWHTLDALRISTNASAAASGGIATPSNRATPHSAAPTAVSGAPTPASQARLP